MYKTVVGRPEGLKAPSVDDIYSVSNCISPDFADWINAWKHNGYRFFDDPQIIEELARAECIVLDEMTLFFYRMYEQEWDPEDKEWRRISPESGFRTKVGIPRKLVLEGFDVVTCSSGKATARSLTEGLLRRAWQAVEKPEARRRPVTNSGQSRWTNKNPRRSSFVVQFERDVRNFSLNAGRFDRSSATRT